MSNRILFVDDESNILDSFRRQLRGKFEIETANSGQEALRELAANPYAIIVADMRMPGMDGLELLGTVHAAYPKVVRMMLTGNADRQTAVDAVNKGQVFQFLTKPCAPEELTAALRAGLELYYLEAQIDQIQSFLTAA
jgi:DNA-binding NtrC family response regulator